MDDFDDFLPETNKEYRVKKLNPKLDCSFCPPNRGENSNHHHRKNRRRDDYKRVKDMHKKSERKFKKNQHKKVDDEE